MTIVLETQRLILREFEIDDAKCMFDLNNDPEVIRYTGDQPFTAITDAEALINNYEQYKAHGYGRWTVLLKDTLEYMGWCGLSFSHDSGETDLGFRLLRKNWNKGFATEAAEASLGYGLTRLGLQRVIGRAQIENVASIRVLQKIGMKFESEFVAHGGRCVKYYIGKSV